ncbi:MAG: hypothetical protein KC478_02355 [Bacteriovoracaceae bacterium]|nr:hypothetical protein [Bacteriovoracaceae bacterium]
MSNISLYLNSKASGSSSKWVKEVQNQLFRHDIAIKSPSSKEQLHIELEKDIANSVDYIFCFGGDGTVNCILQKIAKTDIKLLIIPCGTANDLAHEIGMSTSIKNIVRTFQHKTFKKIDLIEVNGKYMSTNGGIGCAADVAGKINSYRNGIDGFLKVMKRVGSSIYPMVFAKELLFTELKKYTLQIEAQELPSSDRTVVTPLVLINNQPCLGGRFAVAPHTRNTDGKFNVTIFKHKSKKELLQCAYNILRGSYPYDDKNLISFETESLKVKELNGQSLPFFGDGEILDNDGTFEIKAHPRALEVCAYFEDVSYASSYDLAQVRLV